MMRQFAVAVLLAGLAGYAAADEKPIPSHIASVALFKNGLAVVQRTLTVDGPGSYCVEDVPEPIHGTFWVESDAKIATRLTRRLVDVPVRQSGGNNFQEELAGHEVVIHFSDQGIPVATGTVVELDPPHGEGAWSRGYQPPCYDYNSYYGGERRPAAGRMLVLSDGSGRCYVDPLKIAYLQVKDKGKTVKQRKAVMLFTVAEIKKKATIAISYLAKGMAWAPSYRVDLSDPKTLVLRQNAVIKNEMEPIRDAQVGLISGFPSVQFANVTSPLSLNTTWASFFQQLSQQYFPGNALTMNAVVQQAPPLTNGADQGPDLSAIPAGEGVDLHYQDIGRQTLGEGDSLALETAVAKASYERIVEWVVPDTRQGDGAYISERERDNEPDRYHDAVWDAVRFRNPLGFPMTTAPAMVVAGGRFNGQRLSHWADPGEETTLQVTKTLSIRARSVEQEMEGSREIVYVGGHQYRKASIQGELQVNNHRKEAVTLVVRRRFSGELLSADQSPKQTLLEEGVFSVNKRSQLLWNFKLKAGEETDVTYRYTVLVRH